MQATLKTARIRPFTIVQHVGTKLHGGPDNLFVSKPRSASLQFVQRSRSEHAFLDKKDNDGLALQTRKGTERLCKGEQHKEEGGSVSGSWEDAILW